ncbi:MAG: TetR/AcrR family transcriptional regulator [Carboxydocellales bacterium]
MQRNKAKTIEDLSKAAYIVFSQKGYERATVDEIAAVAGYTKGAFYWHFTSKEDLFVKIIDYRIQAQQGEFLEYFNVKKDLLTNVHEVFIQMVEFTRNDNWTPIFVEFLAQAGRNEIVRKKMSSMYADWRGFLVKILSQLQEVGYIPKETDTHTTAAVIVAFFDGFNMQNLVEPGIIDSQFIIKYLTKVLS